MKTQFFLLALIIGFSASAQVVDPVGKDKLGNGGYDLVAYFLRNAAMKGNANISLEHKGVRYHFATTEHRDLFKKNPEKYLPACDGYCAWGVAEKGIKVQVDPKTFKVIDGKLYLFFNGNFNGAPFNTLTEWNKNEKQLLNQLPGNWEKAKKL